MKVYGCQFDIAWEDKAANYQRVRGLLEKARPEKGSLVFLPEMFPTGFSMNAATIAEDPPTGSTPRFLGEYTRELGIYIVGGFAAMGPDRKARNELAVFGPDGECIARYAKLYPFAPGGESQHYVAGEAICRFSWSGATVSPFICYDLRFPEVFRIAAHGGAEILGVIANWPSAREEHWVTLLRARAIENQAFVIGVNRCGNDPKLTYPGRSMIVDPRGTTIADAGKGEGVISAEIDLAGLREYRAQFPVLADLRPKFLGVRAASPLPPGKG
ncbi:MAG TPA: carbon-nitrogen family hydrolase [Tepidisphaeraceae bacterium]|jgi:predicted amidohydrolase